MHLFCNKRLYRNVIILVHFHFELDIWADSIMHLPIITIRLCFLTSLFSYQFYFTYITIFCKMKVIKKMNRQLKVGKG